MARTQAVAKPAEPIAQAAPVKTTPEICATCWAWVKYPNAPTFGQCRASHTGMQAMLNTTDKTSCSLWPAEKFNPEKRLA